MYECRCLFYYETIKREVHVDVMTREWGVVYYEWMKWELEKGPIYECRCDSRLNTKVEESIRHTHTGSGVSGVFIMKREIYTQCQVSVVPTGTWPMTDSEGLWVVRISSHDTVCLIGSPSLDQGCSLIIFWLVIKTHERERQFERQDLSGILLWIKKARTKDKPYIWVSVWWKTKN